MSKKIKSIICCVCASLVLVVALCLPFAFKLNTKSTYYASADEVVSSEYAFNGSGYPVSFTGDAFSYNSSVSTWTTYHYNAMASLRINFYNSGGSVYCNFVLTDVVVVYNSVPQTTLKLAGSFTSSSYQLTDVDTNLSVRFDLRDNLYIIMTIVCNMPLGYVCDIGSFTIASLANSEQLSSVVFTYTNSSSIDCSFSVRFYSAFAYTLAPLNYDTRVYYLSTSLSDNEYYSAGYNDGYDIGNVAGQTAGYDTGYSAGDSVGYTRGYNAGVNATNTYSFTNLISAVLDAPINAFTSLFNFEILGVNLSSFLLALFTIAVVLTVIKIIF